MVENKNDRPSGEDIRLENARRINEAMSDKCANDIITGIANNSDVPANRGIWELVQNARDVSKSEKKSEVIFIRRENEFVFRHNGQEFDIDSILALILQTSSKKRDDLVQAGQYGTGFLTTHKFGLSFTLKGSLKVINSMYYHNFDEFIVDRSHKDRAEMCKNIQCQLEEYNKLGADQNKLETSPAEETIFTYIHKHKIEQDNVREAFEKSIDLVPYVLALNTSIKSITFIDEVDKSKEEYVYESTKTADEFEDIRMEAVTINRESNGCSSRITVFLLKSNTEIEPNINESKVTVILPLRTINECDSITPLSEGSPQLYLYLPLLGTENWGWNYIVHAPSFTCDKDTRDSLLFVGNGQNNDDQAENNCGLIKLAGDLIKRFIEHKLSDYKEDRKHFCKINFLADKSLLENKPELSSYYKGLQERWVEYFEDQPLVKSGDNYLNVREIKVLDKEMYRACEDDKKLLDALYEFISKPICDWVLPEKEDLLYWSRCMDEWYQNKTNNHVITLVEICKKVESAEIKEADIEWLHTLCLYLKKNPHSDIEIKKIVPNECLKLSQPELVKPEAFNETYRSVMKVLVPCELDKFIHSRFYDIFDDIKDYGFEDAKKAINDYIKDSYADKLESKRSKLMIEIIAKRNYNEEDYKAPCMQDEHIHAILDLYKMLLPLDGTGFPSKVFKLLSEFYDYYSQTGDRLDSKSSDDGEPFDVRTCYNALLNDALYKFTLLDKDGKRCLKDWNLKIVKELFNFSDAKGFLRNYLVYPNQREVHRYASELKKEKESTMPEGLKEFYDIICKGIKEPSDDHTKSIYYDLVLNEYGDYFAGDGEIDGHTLATEIQQPFIEDSTRLTIEEDKNKDTFLEIIKKLNNESDGRIWRNLFNTINERKHHLMLSVINNPQKCEYIYQIIKEDENRLKTITELTKRDDFDEIQDNFHRIIELGKTALMIEYREKYDFEVKKMLGKYVEDFLLETLRDVIDNQSLKVDVDNEQGGQDLIVKLNDEPLYYIEVKSRWNTDQSVLMSTTQHKVSCKQAERYALCAVNMSNCDKELAKRHEYPDIEKLINRIRVLKNIGELNKRIQDAVTDKKDVVYIAGGYQVLVSQDVINANGISFTDFVKDMKNRINDTITIDDKS